MTFDEWHKANAKYMEPKDFYPWLAEAFEAGRQNSFAQFTDEVNRLNELNVMLLNALREMVEAYQYEGSMDNPSLIKARAAIAKATGDQA